MKGKLIQLFSAFAISLGNILGSFSIVWPSYTLKLLKSDQSPVGRVTNTDCSLIASLPMLGMLAGLLMGGVLLSDKIGRKTVEICCGLGFILSWILKANATNVIMVLFARFVIGLAIIIHMSISMPFINELSQRSFRGTTGSIAIFCYSSGVLMSYICGWMFSYDVINYICIALGAIFVVLLSILEESPSYLVKKGKEKKALKSLKFYRGVTSSRAVLDEMEYIRKLIQKKPVNGILTDLNNEDSEQIEIRHKGNTDPDQEISAWKFLLKSKPTQRALVTVTVEFILLVFGGSIAVETYAEQMFTAAAPGLSPHACSVCLAISFLLGSMLAVVLSDFLGRRTQMISSSILSSCCLALLASLLRWSWGPEWMIPAAVVGYALCFQAGVAVMPLVQLSECFILKMKGLVTTIVFSMMCVSNFIVLAVFPLAVETIGLDGAFLAFAAVCALTTLVTTLFMQETKGAPIEDILHMYERGYLYRSHYK